MNDRPTLERCLHNALQADCVDFPADLAERYRREGYWRGDTLAGAIDELAAGHPERPALTDATGTCTYAMLAERVAGLARGFAMLGLSAGDVAVVQLPNRISFVATVLAMTAIGVVPVFALPAHRKLEIAQFCRFTRAKAYVAADMHGGFDYRELAQDLRWDMPHLNHIIIDGRPNPGQMALESLCVEPGPLPHSAAPEDVAVFQISGGTTGMPKLIPRRHHEYLYNMRRAAEMSGLGPQSVFLCVLPVAHNFPFACPGVMGTLLSGGHAILSESVEAEENFALIRRHGVTLAALVPPLAMAWMEAAPASGEIGLDLLQVGGARMAEEAARRVGPKLGCRLQQVYGMAEGLICYTPLDGDPERVCRGESYPMSPADEVRVVDPRGDAVAPGEPGLLQVRGPYTMRGYFRAPEKNAESFTEDGFYVPGDLVVRGEDGSVTVVGRLKEQINRGGEKLSGEELENALIAHAGVIDAAVVGLPDAVLGERICAFVQSRDEGLRPLALKRFLRGQGLAAFKLPDEIRLVETFPSTGVGKVNKTMLRQLLREAELRVTGGEVRA